MESKGETDPLAIFTDETLFEHLMEGDLEGNALGHRIFGTQMRRLLTDDSVDFYFSMLNKLPVNFQTRVLSAKNRAEESVSQLIEACDNDKAKAALHALCPRPVPRRLNDVLAVIHEEVDAPDEEASFVDEAASVPVPPTEGPAFTGGNFRRRQKVARPNIRHNNFFSSATTIPPGRPCSTNRILPPISGRFKTNGT